MYKELKFDKVIATIDKLETRISERFPNSGISKVSYELSETANSAQARIEKNIKT